MSSIDLFEISRTILEWQREIFGGGCAADEALREAEKYPEGVRFYKSHGSIIVVPKNQEGIL